MFAKVLNAQLVTFPYGYAQLQADNPYTAFNAGGLEADFYGTEAWQEGYRLVPVVELPQPSYDPGTQVAVQDVDPTLTEGVWILGWTVRPMTPEETEARKQEIKTQASELLSATDWVDIPSVSDPANNPHLLNRGAFNAYRLALRQIAVYMPVDPVWPIRPEEEWGA